MPAGDDFWDDILGHLTARMLVAFVVPELLTVPADGRAVTLSRLLAERLASRYGLAVT